MEDYEVSNANEWNQVTSKKNKTPKKTVAQTNVQLSSLKSGPFGQQSHKPSLKNENHKTKAQAALRTASSQPSKQSYSVIAQRPAVAQAKGPLQNVGSQQQNSLFSKNSASAKPLLRPPQPAFTKSQSKHPKQTPINSTKSRIETSAQRPVHLPIRKAEPNERHEGKKIVTKKVAERTQQHTVPGQDFPKFNVTYTETSRGPTLENTKHTTVASAQLPFHRRFSTSSNQTRQRPSVPDRYQRHLLESEEDNLAKNDYRQRKNPTVIIPLPKYSVISCSGNKSRNSSTTERLKQIELYTSTCIIPSTAEGSWTSVLKVWGTSEQASLAADLIQSWINEPKPARGKKWAHIPSLNDTQKEKLRKRLKREEKQHEFRKAPPEGVNFGWIGVFGWPVYQYRPDEVLGRNCEALDPIRMEYYVYISWNAAEKHFAVYGQRQDQVEAVMECLNHTFCQVIARTFAVSEMTRSFTKPPRASCNQQQIKLIPAYTAKNEHFPPHKDDPRRSIRLYGPSIQGPDAASRRANAYMKNCRNEDRIIQMIFQALERLRWYRGNLQMRARLGNLVISRYMKTPNGQYSLDMFEDMMSSDTVRAYVCKGLGNIQANVLPARMQRASHVLFPLSNLTRESGEMKPIISGTFVICGDNGTSNLKLHVEFYEVADKYELLTTKWSRLERDKTEPAEVINLKHINVESGLGWQFTITASGPLALSRVPENHQAFARSIKVRTPYTSSMGPTERLLTFDSPAAFGVPLITFEETVTWRFNMVMSEYVCEVMRSQRVVMPRKSNNATATELSSAPTYPNAYKGKYRVCGSQATLYEPEWCLQVWHNNWDTVFDQNVALPIGKRAKWEPDPAVFFPSDFQPLAEAAESSTIAAANATRSKMEFAAPCSSDDGAQTSSESESEQRRRLRDELRSKPQRKPKIPRDPKNPFPGSREGFRALNARLRNLQALVLDEEFCAEEYEMPLLGDAAVYAGLDSDDNDDGFDDGFDDLIYE